MVSQVLLSNNWQEKRHRQAKITVGNQWERTHYFVTPMCNLPRVVSLYLLACSGKPRVPEYSRRAE